MKFVVSLFEVSLTPTKRRPETAQVAADNLSLLFEDPFHRTIGTLSHSAGICGFAPLKNGYPDFIDGEADSLGRLRNMNA